MFTFATLFLWIGGLILIGAGHMVIGALIAAAGVPASIKALTTPDDMETFWGWCFLFVLVVTAARIVDALLP